MNIEETKTFRHIIERLTKTTNVGFYIIHLERATERMPLINTMENELKIKLNIFDAADGPKLVKEGHPTTCQQRGPPATRGAGCVGCTVSHVNICKDALANNYDYVVIFEDDCVFKSNLDTLSFNINEFINLNMEWDLFLLGWDPQSWSNISDTNISKVSRFNCTHAGVYNAKFLKEIIKTYNEYYNNNTTLSIDTMYSNIIETHNLNAYGFKNHNSFFTQNQELYSYVLERVRS